MAFERADTSSQSGHLSFQKTYSDSESRLLPGNCVVALNSANSLLSAGTYTLHLEWSGPQHVLL